MANHNQSNIKCHSMAEIYYVGSLMAEGRSIRRYDRAPLIYDEGRQWYPAFIVDSDTIVEVRTSDSIIDVEQMELERDGVSSIRAKLSAHRKVKLVNGLDYKGSYESYVVQGKIRFMATKKP